MAVDAATNRERVKKAQAKVDRLNLYLPKGTIKRIACAGYKPTDFARTLILEEIEKLEKIKKKN